jgi:hypothetical protein
LGGHWREDHLFSLRLALRKTRESDRTENTVLESNGDVTVTHEVIAPYHGEQN